MTPRIAEEIFCAFAGFGNYLIREPDLMDLLDARDDAGHFLVEVLAPTCCLLMGAEIELSHRARPGEAQFWVWKLQNIERPDWLPPLDDIWQ